MLITPNPLLVPLTPCPDKVGKKGLLVEARYVCRNRCRRALEKVWSFVDIFMGWSACIIVDRLIDQSIKQ